MPRKPEEDSASEGRNKRIVLITHFNVFLYAACYWIQSGTLPYLTKSLGADPVIFGRLKTVFSLCQLVGGPIYGRLGDLMGERTALITAFSASVLTYTLTGLATSLPLLFLSRVPSVFLHVMQGSQMVVTALSGSNDRAASLARLGFSYGVGMVIGPSLGGFVAAAYGEHAAAWLAALGSAFSLALVIYFVPEVPRPREEKGDSVLNIAKIGALLLIPKARNLLLLKTICGVPIGVLQSMFSLIAMEQFQLPPEQNGMVLSYIGGLSMLMQVIFLPIYLMTSANKYLTHPNSGSWYLCLHEQILRQNSAAVLLPLPYHLILPHGTPHHPSGLSPSAGGSSVIAQNASSDVQYLNNTFIILT